VYYSIMIFVLILAPLVAWKNYRWMVGVVAFCLLVSQLIFMTVGLDSAGRALADQTVHSGVAVRETLDAITKLHYAQLRVRVATFVSGLGLFLLAVIRRPGVREDV
jgi:hypothetical protein